MLGLLRLIYIGSETEQDIEGSDHNIKILWALESNLKRSLLEED